MVTNQDIERTFFKVNMQLNNKINQAQYEFYKPEIMQNMKLMEIAMKRTLMKKSNNPLEVNNGIRS